MNNKVIFTLKKPFSKITTKEFNPSLVHLKTSNLVKMYCSFNSISDNVHKLEDNFFYNNVATIYEKNKKPIFLFYLATFLTISKLKFAFDPEKKTINKKLENNLDYISNVGCKKKIEKMLNDVRTIRNRLERNIDKLSELYLYLDILDKFIKNNNTHIIQVTDNNILEKIINVIKYPKDFSTRYYMNDTNNSVKSLHVNDYNIINIKSWLLDVINDVETCNNIDIFTPIHDGSNDGVGVLHECIMQLQYIYKKGCTLDGAISYTRENNRKEKSIDGSYINIEYCNKTCYDYIYSCIDRYLESFNVTNRNRIYVNSLEEYGTNNKKIISHKALATSEKEAKQDKILILMWERLSEKELLKIKTKHLEILQLHAIGYGYETIARRVGMSKGAVEKAIKRTYEKLLKRIQLNIKDDNYIDIHKLYNSCTKEVNKQLDDVRERYKKQA